MKKVLCIILAVVMLIVVFVVPVYAQELQIEQDPKHLFEAQFVSEKEHIDAEVYQYDELIYHYDSDENIDWALVYAVYCYSDPLNTYVVVGDRVCTYPGFNYGAMTFYWLYDNEQKQFFDIMLVDWNDYEGLEQAIEKQELGRPIGDADFDIELTICDATYIQRVLAGICEYNHEDDISGYYQLNEELKYVSDIDRDGERTVMDATAIQKKLANIDDSTVTE